MGENYYILWTYTLDVKTDRGPKEVVVKSVEGVATTFREETTNGIEITLHCASISFPYWSLQWYLSEGSEMYFSLEYLFSSVKNSTASHIYK